MTQTIMALSSSQQVQQVKDQYDSIGEHFSKTREKRMWAEILPFTKIVKSGMKVLDVGCGNGRLVPEFKGKKIQYLGIDFSEELLSKAKERFSNRRFLNRDITREEDWERIGMYDAVFCLATLHHIPDRNRQHEILQQIYKHTKPGGFCVISVWNLWQWNYLRIHLSQIGKKFEYGNLSYVWMPYRVSDGKQTTRKIMRFCKAFFAGELLALVKQAGFKIKKFYYATNGKTHQSIFTGRNFVICARKPNYLNI